MTRVERRRALLVLACAAALAGSVARAELSPEQLRGKQVFLRGESPSGAELTAIIGGEGGLEVPASALPCASCHGSDGKGRPEGGVTPTDLTWERLTRPDGVVHASGRKHPAYTPRALKKAIALGLDPAGNRLDSAMPRYRLAQADMADLVAYLQKLGEDRDPGIFGDRLRLGTVLPPGGLGDTVEAVVRAVFAEVDAGGGVYGRQLELVVQRVSEPASGLERLAAEGVFAATALVGAEPALAAAAAERELPIVGVLGGEPQTGFPLNRQVFYLFSGSAEQGRALVRHAAARLGKEMRAAIVGFEGQAALAAIVEEAESAGWPAPRAHALGPALAAELAAAGVQVVVFLGGGDDALGLLAAAAEAGFKPEVLMLGERAGTALAEAAKGFAGKVFLTFPTLPSDAGPRGIDDYRALAARHALPREYLGEQIAALAAARLLVEGLERAGRELSREKLIHELEGLYDHPTALTPPLTFGPNRRIGALGAHVAEIDLASGGFLRVEWVDLR